jgi:hypothetical protein
MTRGVRMDSTLGRMLGSWLGEAGWDVVVGLTWAALVVAIVLFSGVATQFAYVDF